MTEHLAFIICDYFKVARRKLIEPLVLRMLCTSNLPSEMNNWYAVFKSFHVVNEKRYFLWIDNLALGKR